MPDEVKRLTEKEIGRIPELLGSIRSSGAHHSAAVEIVLRFAARFVVTLDARDTRIKELERERDETRKAAFRKCAEIADADYGCDDYTAADAINDAIRHACPEAFEEAPDAKR